MNTDPISTVEYAVGCSKIMTGTLSAELNPIVGEDDNSPRHTLQCAVGGENVITLYAKALLIRIAMGFTFNPQPPSPHAKLPHPDEDISNP